MSKHFGLQRLHVIRRWRRELAGLLGLTRSFLLANAPCNFTQRFGCGGTIAWSVRRQWGVDYRRRGILLARFNRRTIFGREDLRVLQIFVGVNVRRLFLGVRGFAGFFLAPDLGVASDSGSSPCSGSEVGTSLAGVGPAVWGPTA